MLGIGIDTGGTCTDAVIFDFDTGKVLHSGKALTTKQNLEIGIANALDTLPQDLVKQAGNIALSTTLATNACLENKGARAKLLLIGFNQNLMDNLKEVYAAYGMQDMTRFVCIDGKAEGAYTTPEEPDWESLKRHAPEYFADCDSVGVVQLYPKYNAGRFELTALKILKEELEIPVTISYEISNEIDILKTCAGTLINAMLIPLISEFMTAIKNVCKVRGLNIPITIILSNGTMVPESTARQFPVETILCGPAASVVGGSALADEENGIIVDMGGTTTDIAIVRNHVPVTADGGIKIGRWKTMVEGIYVDTIGLGGDSSVQVDNHVLRLDNVRQVPLSVLAAQYDNVLPSLRETKEKKGFCYSCDYEFLVLLKDISGKTGYTDEEQAVCAALKDKPLTVTQLSEKLGQYRRFLPLKRLESDGVIIRSGLTPTDMMILKGDFDMYDPEAASIGVFYMSQEVNSTPEEFPDLVYELVVRKMYNALGRVILTRQFPRVKGLESPEVLGPVLDAFYQQAVRRCDKPEEYADDQGLASLTTRMPLIGVGAPIHIFLPRVAELFGTRGIVPEYAGVANALGAVACRKVANERLVINAVYENGALIGYALPVKGRRHFFKKYAAAVDFAKEAILEIIREKAVLHGIEGEPNITVNVENYRIGRQDKGLLLDVIVTATATE